MIDETARAISRVLMDDDLRSRPRAAKHLYLFRADLREQQASLSRADDERIFARMIRAAALYHEAGPAAIPERRHHVETLKMYYLLALKRYDFAMRFTRAIRARRHVDAAYAALGWRPRR